VVADQTLASMLSLLSHSAAGLTDKAIIFRRQDWLPDGRMDAFN